jgi:3-deoxy-D-manno-octulosonic-acid transferase
MLMRFLYTTSIHLYNIAIHVAALFNPKAKLWVRGRKNIFQQLRATLKTNDSKLLWVHCASLGEFEQGRPLIERLKNQDSGVKILLTFFSPSGYEIRKNYAGADYVFYLPIDTARNAKQFVELVKPKAVFFVKYEFWFNYLHELKNQHIPTYLISGIFREDQHFFKGYGKWFRKQLNSFTHFYLQDRSSLELLQSLGFENVTVAGDTRFDRVFEIANNVKQIDVVKQFVGDKKVLIAGSTWAEDEKIIADWLNKNQESRTNSEQLATSNYKLIIAPHEIDETHIQAIISLFSNFQIVRYSQANEVSIKTAQLLIIDNIGMLSSLYQYGHIAFIGGGFGKGIHNILEAATFGLPILFGPNYQKFTEAKELIRLGGAFSITDASAFEKNMLLLNDEQVLKTASHIAKYYVQSRVGATDTILSAVSIK